MIPPLGLIVMIGMFYAMVRFPKNIVIVSIIPFILVHFIISHKETRFLFPLIDAVPVCLALTWSRFQGLFDKRRKLTLGIGKIFVGFNVVCIIVLLLKPQQQPYDLYKVVYDKYWNSGAYVFCTSDDPYSFIGLVVNYYKPDNFTFYSELRGKNIDSIMAHANTGTHPVLMFFDREHDEYDFIKRHPDAKRIYTSSADWMHWVNINNWISRAIKLSLYEMPRAKLSTFKKLTTFCSHLQLFYYQFLSLPFPSESLVEDSDGLLWRKPSESPSTFVRSVTLCSGRL